MLLVFILKRMSTHVDPSIATVHLSMEPLLLRRKDGLEGDRLSF